MCFYCGKLQVLSLALALTEDVPGGLAVLHADVEADVQRKMPDGTFNSGGQHLSFTLKLN